MLKTPKKLVLIQRMLGATPVLEATIAIVFTFSAVSIILALLGISPGEVVRSLLRGALGTSYGIVGTLNETVPLFLCGLAFLIPFLCGFFNIGTQGQLELGALVSILICLNLNGPPLVVVPLSLFCGIIGGIFAIIIPLLLSIYRGTNEVVTTIMSNFIYRYFIYALLMGPLKEPGAWFATTPRLPRAYQLPKIFLHAHAGVLIAGMVGILFYFLIRYTTFGLKLRAIGLNPTAALFAGVKVRKIRLQAVLLGGALAGLAGAIQVLGVVYRVAEGWSKPWGFLGLPVALFGGCNVFGVLAAAFFLAMLEVGSRHMQAMTGIPAAFVLLLQNLPLAFLLAIRSSRVLTQRLEKIFLAKEKA